MIPARWTPVLVPLVMTGMLTFCVSFLLTIHSLGFPPDVVTLWLQNWALAWCFAFPTALVTLPLAQRIVGRVTRP